MKSRIGLIVYIVLGTLYCLLDSKIDRKIKRYQRIYR